MMLGADPAIVRTLNRVISVKRANSRGKAVQQFLDDSFVREDVIGRDTGLPGIGELAPGVATRRDGKVGVLVHETRTLAAKLEGHRGEAFGGVLQNDAADS